MKKTHLFTQLVSLQPTKSTLRGMALTALFSSAFVFGAQAESREITSQNSFVEMQNNQCVGLVIDKSGSPILGASVIIDGTTMGITTGVDGSFTLNANPGAKLIVSYLGYTTQEVVYNGKALRVILSEDNMSLDEVVVVGFGSQKKANLTGSVASVSAEDLSSVPAGNVTSMLQGKLPGVAITQNTGQPGLEETSIRVRGVGTMNNANPMVIVDGMEGSMNDINPNDIESISVLKDAAASAIYGTRAANGVILITTKRGKAGDTRVSYNGYFGIQHEINYADPVDSWDYAMLINEAKANEGKNPIYTDEDIQLFKDGTSPYTHPNTDWREKVFQGSGIVNNHSVSINGGSEKSRFSASMGYLNQDGLVENTEYERYNVRFNLDTKIGKKLNYGISSSLIYGTYGFPQHTTSNASGVNQGNMNEFFRGLNRFSSAIVSRHEDGSWGSYSGVLSPEGSAIDGGIMQNVFARVNGSTFLEYEIINGLKLKGMAGVNYLHSGLYNNFKAMTDFVGNSFGATFLSNELRDNLNTTLQAFLNYDKSFGGHNVKAMMGVSRESSLNRYLYASRRDAPSNDLTDLDAGSKDGWTNAGNTSEVRIGSYFGRINYDYKGKYLFEANVRVDGSSKFARGYRWGTFPSFSAGWRLTEEKFMKDTRSWLDDVKLRASWGQLGNHNTGNYAYLQLITLGSTIYPFGDGVVTGAAQTAANNPIVSWETTTETDFGFDATFLSGMFNLTVDYYDRYTDDILTSVPVTNSFGLNAPTTNAGAMRNKGIEVAVGHKHHFGEFSYGIDGYFAKNKNNVEKFPSPSVGDYIKKEGIAWNSHYGYECIGVFMNEEDLASYPKYHKNTNVGDLKFKDQNGDNKITAADKVVLGNPIPSVTFGFNLSLAYKGFDFLAAFQGATDVEREYQEQIYFPLIKGDNAWDMHLDRTIVNNETNEVTSVGFFPRTLIENEQNLPMSSFTVLDASYLRLKNLQLGYTLPQSWVNDLHINRARIYASATNLLTFSSLPVGLDPEAANTNGGGSYPHVAFYTIGLDINF